MRCSAYLRFVAFSIHYSDRHVALAASEHHRNVVSDDCDDDCVKIQLKTKTMVYSTSWMTAFRDVSVGAFAFEALAASSAPSTLPLQPSDS